MINWTQTLLITSIYILLTPAQEIKFLGRNKLHQSRNISHREKNTENKKMSKFTNLTKSIDFRINKSDWFVEINSPSRQLCRQYFRLNIFDKNRGNQNLCTQSEYLLKGGITITAEYFPGKLNVTADWESQNNLNSSQWILSHQFFEKDFSRDRFVCFPSITSLTYVVWKSDPHSYTTDAFQQNC